ncbi:MAG: hypothetical protein ACI9O0_000527 [Paracoccaceae bacterium]|jgi:hypothetical protein
MLDEFKEYYVEPDLTLENLDVCKRFICRLGIEADKTDNQIADILAELDFLWSGGRGGAGIDTEKATPLMH